MRTALVGLSFLIPLCAGWLIAARLWPDSKRLFRLALSWIIGSGIAGTVYFTALTLSNSRRISLGVSEVVLLGAIVILISRKGAPSRYPTRLPPETGGVLDGKITGVAFILTGLLAAGAFLFISDYNRYGEWDAIAIWNLKARFIVRSEAAPVDRIVDPYLGDTHPDYPMLLPSVVARSWQYAGLDSTIISEGIAALFAFSTFLVAFCTIRLLAGRSHAFLLGCILLSTPFFLVHGAWQYADIVLACFITATVSMFCIWDSGIGPRYLALLAGLFAGFAASTKNEGILFLLVAFVARIVLLLVRKNYREGRGEIARFSVGAVPGFVALLLFKVIHAPPNDIAGQATFGLWISRMQDIVHHATIWRAFVKEIHNFGSWWAWPIPLMILYLIVSRMTTPRSNSTAALAMPALVLLGMMAGDYTAYMLTHDNLPSHLQTSLSRLMLQVWPTALILYFLIVAGPERLKE